MSRAGHLALLAVADLQAKQRAVYHVDQIEREHDLLHPQREAGHFYDL